MYDNPFYIQGEFTQSSNTQVSNKKQDLDISHFAGLNLIENRLNDSYGRQTVNPAQFASPFLYQGNIDPLKPPTKSCCGGCNGGKGCDGGADNKGCSGGCGSGKDFEKIIDNISEVFIFDDYGKKLFSFKSEKFFDKIITDIIDINQNITLTSINFKMFKKDLYFLPNSTEYFPITNIESLSIAMGVIFVSNEFVKNKISTINEVLTKSKKTILSPIQNEINNLCISHDMACSFPGITLEGKINWYFPCAGSFSINVLDCCKDHDINLWCAKTFIDIENANHIVIQCVADAIYNKTLSEMPFFCKVTFGAVYTFLHYIILNSLVHSLSPYLSLKFYLGKSQYVNLDGSHNDSCLCGGTKATFCCDSSKNPDYCKTTNGNLKNLCKEKCFPCSWKCKYDSEGNPIDKVMMKDPTNKLSCCAGTPGHKNKFNCAI
jgi:hypothetical protein